MDGKERGVFKYMGVLLLVMIPKHFKKQAIVFYIFLFSFSYILLMLDRALALIFLGSAFILLGPFMLIERHSIPIKNIFVAVSSAIALTFIGGVLWHLATLV